jgi:hypothetical protein
MTEFLYNVEFNKHQALNLVLQLIAGNHGTPTEGSIWWDSSANAVKVYDGSTVITLGTAGGGGDAETLDGQDGTYYLARANHTGSQLAATISDFATAVLAQKWSDMADPTASVDLNSQKIVNLANGTANTDAAAFGQIATAVANLASESYVDTAISNLVDSSPGTLDTLNELAAALGDDANFSTTITNLINARAKKFASNVGNGSATQIDITHNFGSRDVGVEVYYNSTPWASAQPGVRRPDTNTVRLMYGTAPTTDQFRVVILGG